MSAKVTRIYVGQYVSFMSWDMAAVKLGNRTFKDAIIPDTWEAKDNDGNVVGQFSLVTRQGWLDVPASYFI